MDSGLSLRMQRTLRELDANTTRAGAPPRPTGSLSTTVDLSNAQNEVIRPEILEFFKGVVEERLSEEVFALASLNNSDVALRDALASFFNAHFKPVHAVKPEHLVLTAGASDAISSVIHAVCDEGDSVLIPGPYWPGFNTLIRTKPAVHILHTKPPTNEHWDNYLLASLLAAYDFSDDPSRIKAVVLCNPHNPLGRCYPRETLLELMEFCQERGLHLIVDEVYALTELNARSEGRGKENGAAFVSALSLTEPLVASGAVKVDASRVHVVWSASKLFGLSGLRVGCILTQSSPPLLAAVSLLATPPSTLSASLLAPLLAWPLLPTLLALNASRLTARYALLSSFLAARDIEFITPTHGLFVAARLARGVKSVREEAQWFDALERDEGVRVARGSGFRGTDGEFGWGRVRFSCGEEELRRAVEGMGRFLEAESVR
ncbi:hypothetical protein ACN47E_000020 [Coniothyrium glycines]